MPHACGCVSDNRAGITVIPARSGGEPSERQDAPGTYLRGRLFAASERQKAPDYLTVTEAPAPSRAALALSAASLLTFSRTVFGAPSTRSLASLRPRLVSDRTSK